MLSKVLKNISFKQNQAFKTTSIKFAVPLRQIKRSTQNR
jgi:hypothetical protein